MSLDEDKIYIVMLSTCVFWILMLCIEEKKNVFLDNNNNDNNEGHRGRDP